MNHARMAICQSSFKICSLKNTKCIHQTFMYQNWYFNRNYCLKFPDSGEREFQNEIGKLLPDVKSNWSHIEGQNLEDNDFESADGTDLASDVLTHIKENQIKQQNTKSIFYPSKHNDQFFKYGKHKRKLNEGPGLIHFISNHNSKKDLQPENIPYLSSINGNKQKVYLEIYGCQMNVNDAEIISAILTKHNYEITKNIENATVILLVTCAIRDSAEQKIWNKLKSLRQYKQKNAVSKIGLLGCMAERLKQKIIEEEKIVDIVAGPDSYKDLPRLLAINNEHETAINVTLSFDETYADVTPVRLNPDSKTAYVSIMRGCDNMCTYCIVPFTRGRERSRPISSILQEVKKLSDQGVKEVTLLGQNVNSYRDLSQINFYNNSNTKTNLAKGFKTVYKSKEGGLRFTDLLDKVSLINPEMRIRFTSPHPKDFPDEVLYLIGERTNICQQIHLPAQSGNTEVLNRMRRGYTREAYLELVHHIRSIIPKIALSSDFIAGFCNETEEEFNDTLSLIEEVKYSTAYLFAYSMREKTTAHRRFEDNVERKIKIERLQKLIKLYRLEVEKIHRNYIGQQQLVLVEKESKRSPNDLQGRNDANIKVIFSNEDIPTSNVSTFCRPIKYGDYIVVHICNSNSQILRGIPLYHSSINAYHSIDRFQSMNF